VWILDTAPFREANLVTEALRYGTLCGGITQFYLHTHAFIHKRSEAGLHFTDPRKMSRPSWLVAHLECSDRTYVD